MRPEWLPYEIRRLGRLGLATPVLIALLFAGIAGLTALAGADVYQIGRRLTAGLEEGLPLAAGLAAAAVAADELALDLQLTLLTRYRTTVLRRLAVVAGWTALVALLWASVMQLARLWVVPGPFLLGPLAWLAPLLWFVALGTLLALLLRSRVASGAILGGVWLFQQVLGGLLFNYDWSRHFLLLFARTTPAMEEYWLDNRLALVASALVMALGVVLILRNTEPLVTGGDE